MVVNQVVVVVVINNLMMKKLIIILLLLPIFCFSQETSDTIVKQDTNKIYKKRVLETVEIDLISSYYTQDGKNASVTGGIGTEKLSDFASTIDVAIPLNDDDVFVIDATVSAYTSASSSNLNPFSGASSGDDDDDDDDKKGNKNTIKGPTTGTPWVASSGASKSDVWFNGNLGYNHSSDSRNNIVNANVSFANEFDYTSFGFGAGYTHLFNKKNTEIGIKTNIYLDHWRPQYPTEIHTYIENNGSLNADFFNGVDILDNNGLIADKNGLLIWAPFKNTLVDNTSRNSYSISLSFSQIISKNAQFSIFTDIVNQQGWLANPMQRVYFKDKANYYIGIASSIADYTSPTNLDVFQLADDIERLTETRLKTPVGIRLNYYISELFVFKTYYRYYFDDWGIKAHTANIELPIKIAQKFTFYPTYRFYSQIAADYFAPYEEHLSTDKFYTSDFDLSKYNANQYGFGIKYNDIFTKAHIGMMRLKTVDLNYSYYHRNTGLKANIVSFGMKFIVN